MHDSSLGRNVVEVLAEEFLERYRNGDRPPISEYSQRYPDLATEIEDLFPALLMMENLKPAEEEAASLARQQEAAALDHLGDYRIIREVGRGGMGIVYEAEQVSLGRRVALKVLPKEFLTNPKQRSRFEREAKAAAKLHHTNIVPVFGVGEDDAQVYYVMQFIQGLALDEVLEELKRLHSTKHSGSGSLPTGELRVERRAMSAADVAHSLLAHGLGQLSGTVQHSSEPPPPGDKTLIVPSGSIDDADAALDSTQVIGRLSETFSVSNSSADLPGGIRQRSTRTPAPTTYWQSVANIGAQVAGALEYAHGQGVLHRDIKPANLLLDLKGTVWVTDFGLAKLDDDRGLTQTGDILGTLRYMAPETFKGQVDARSELYSLGLTLYELLAFRPAFDQTNRNMLVDQVMQAHIVPLGQINPDVPTDLQTIVHKAVERDPQHRYQSAQELADDLQRFIMDEPIKARRVSYFERLTRWQRHNKGLAAALSAVAALILIINIAGPIFALRLARLNRDLTDSQEELHSTIDELAIARDEAERVADDNLALAETADQARRESLTMLADMQTERGLLAAREGDAATAALWFANAAEQTPHDPARTEANGLRARNWLHSTMLPVAAIVIPHEGRPRKVEFQPQGRLLLTLHTSGAAVWDYENQRPLPQCEHFPQVADACWLADGSGILLGFDTGEIQIRNISDGELRLELTHPEAITAVACSPDNKRIAVAGTTVNVWNITGEPVVEQTWEHPQTLNSLVFSPSGEQLATACRDNNMRVYRVDPEADAEPLFGSVPHFLGENDWIGPIFSPPGFVAGGDAIVSVSNEQLLGWWNTATGENSPPYSLDNRGGGTLQVAVSPTSEWIASQHYEADYHVTVSSLVGNPVRLVHPNGMQNVVFDPHDAYVVTTCWDGMARVWNLSQADRPMLSIPQLEAQVLAAVADDGTLALCGSHGLRVWRQTSVEPRITNTSAWELPFRRPRVSADGQFATIGRWHESPHTEMGQSRRLRVIRMADGQPAGPEIQLPGDFCDSCLCSDSLTVAVGCIDGEIPSLGLYSIQLGDAVAEPIPLSARPQSVVARPSHAEVTVYCSDGSIKSIDSRNGTTLWEITEHYENMFLTPRIEYTPDGMTLIVVDRDQQIVVRDAATGEQRFPALRPARGSICRSVAISADSRWLAAAYNFGANAVYIWDLQTGSPAGEVLAHPGEDDQFGIFAVKFSPDGESILTGDKDGRARYWDWRSGELRCPPLQHVDEVYDVAFTLDGRFAFTAVRNEYIHFWELVTGKEIAPPFELDGATFATMAVTIDRLLVGSPGYPLFDFRPFLNEPEMPVESMCILAELATAHRLQLGELSRLDGKEWNSLWSALSESQEQRPDWESRDE